MKINKLFSILALLLLCLGFASCGDDNIEKKSTGGGGQEILEENLIGTWEEYWEKGWEKDSADPSINDSWNNEIPDEDKTTVTFNADHTIENESLFKNIIYNHFNISAIKAKYIIFSEYTTFRS